MSLLEVLDDGERLLQWAAVDDEYGHRLVGTDLRKLLRLLLALTKVNS